MYNVMLFLAEALFLALSPLHKGTDIMRNSCSHFIPHTLHGALTNFLRKYPRGNRTLRYRSFSVPRFVLCPFLSRARASFIPSCTSPTVSVHPCPPNLIPVAPLALCLDQPASPLSGPDTPCTLTLTEQSNVSSINLLSQATKEKERKCRLLWIG